MILSIFPTTNRSPDLNTINTMNVFLDTASEEEVVERIGTGLISGITTNPSLVLKSSLDYKHPYDAYERLIKIPNLPDVSIEVVADTDDQFIDRGLNTVSYTHLTLPTSDLV